MKTCENCRLQVAGNREYCPLCQAELTGEGDPEQEAFPKIPTVYKQHTLFFRILLFSSIAGGVIALALNFMLPQSGWWSLFVLLGLGCTWASLAIAVRKRGNIPKNLLYQVVLISLLAALWDWVTGWRGWSIDYVVPLVCICAMVAMSVLARVLRLRIQDYMIYLCIDAVFGVVPIVFFLTGVLRVVYPALICVAGSLISLAALLVFEGQNMLLELKRRLHL
ncbi:MAG: DUF6320 domain-containing protein [Oscillospiraceae bacterium]